MKKKINFLFSFRKNKNINFSKNKNNNLIIYYIKLSIFSEIININKNHALILIDIIESIIYKLLK